MYPKSEIIVLGDSPLAREPETPKIPRKMAVSAKNRSSRNFGSQRQTRQEEAPSHSTVSRKRTHPSEAHFDQLVAFEVKRCKLIDDEACWKLARNMVKQMNSTTKKSLLRQRRAERENESHRRPRRDHSDEEDGHNDYAKTVFAYRFASESPDEKRSPKKPWPQMNFYGSMDPVEEKKKNPTPPVSSSPEPKPAKESWIKEFNCRL